MVLLGLLGLFGLGCGYSLDQNHRPILFVAHSLGGLVCEDLIVHVHLIIEAIAGIKDAVQALLASRNSTEKHLQNILSCTRGILFLGTSHGGSALATWAELLAKSVGQTNPQIIDVLKRDSEVLARIQKDFHSMLRARADNHDPSIAITFSYEQLPLPGIDEVSIIMFHYLEAKQVIFRLFSGTPLFYQPTNQ